MWHCGNPTKNFAWAYKFCGNLVPRFPVKMPPCSDQASTKVGLSFLYFLAPNYKDYFLVEFPPIVMQYYMKMTFDGRQPNLWRKKTFDGKRPLMEDKVWWNTTFDGRQCLMKDDLWWKTTFYGRRLLMEDNFWWRTTFDERRPLIEDNLWIEDALFWKMAIDRRHLMDRNSNIQGVGGQRVAGIFKPFIAKAFRSKTRNWSLTLKAKSCLMNIYMNI